MSATQLDTNRRRSQLSARLGPTARWRFWLAAAVIPLALGPLWVTLLHDVAPRRLGTLSGLVLLLTLTVSSATDLSLAPDPELGHLSGGRLRAGHQPGRMAARRRRCRSEQRAPRPTGREPGSDRHRLLLRGRPGLLRDHVFCVRPGGRRRGRRQARYGDRRVPRPPARAGRPLLHVSCRRRRDGRLGDPDRRTAQTQQRRRTTVRLLFIAGLDLAAFGR